MHGSCMQEPTSGNHSNVQAQNGQIVYEHKRPRVNNKGLGNATPYKGALTDGTDDSPGSQPGWEEYPLPSDAT